MKASEILPELEIIARKINGVKNSYSAIGNDGLSIYGLSRKPSAVIGADIYGQWSRLRDNLKYDNLTPEQFRWRFFELLVNAHVSAERSALSFWWRIDTPLSARPDNDDIIKPSPKRSVVSLVY